MMSPTEQNTSRLGHRWSFVV